MTKTRINISKVVLSLSLIIVFKRIILNFIAVYQSDISGVKTTFIGFVIGTIAGLGIRIGFTLLFWYSYNIRYPNEDYDENLTKKIVASCIFLLISSSIIVRDGMLLVFIICTLTIAIIQYKRQMSPKRLK